MRSRNDLFEWHVLRHLDAAHNLAWWFLKNRQDAEDVVQESVMKAFRSFDEMKGPDAKPWLMQIVRNGCLRFLDRRNRMKLVPFEECDDPVASFEGASLRALEARQVQDALMELPELYREVLVLRELEGMNYAEIAEVISAPVGTVMSRIHRARTMLARILREGAA
jgi:RNA polymerase sigma-70 factor (ECF subfamily)